MGVPGVVLAAAMTLSIVAVVAIVAVATAVLVASVVAPVALAIVEVNAVLVEFALDCLHCGIMNRIMRSAAVLRKPVLRGPAMLNDAILAWGGQYRSNLVGVHAYYCTIWRRCQTLGYI